MINNPLYRGTVYPWHCDHVGHMNVMHYVGKFDEATWNLFAELGLTANYLRGANRAMAAVEQKLTYTSELLAGDVVIINGKLLEARDKSIRFALEMLNAATGKPSATCEITALHLDRKARKAISFEDAIMQKLRAASA